MNFSDTVVVEADGLANGILRNFEATIQISSQGGFEIKPDGKGDRMASKPFKKIRPVRGLVEDGREMFSHRAFVVAAYGGENPTPVDCGILMIDAGGQG